MFPLFQLLQDFANPAERRRFYATSRGSLAELAAILDVAEVLGFVSMQAAVQHKAELLGICRILGVLK